MEDFDDWTNWLLYKGGVGVKGDNSWESWWDDEQVSYAPVFEIFGLTLVSLFFVTKQLAVFI